MTNKEALDEILAEIQEHGDVTQAVVLAILQIASDVEGYDRGPIPWSVVKGSLDRLPSVWAEHK